MIGLKLRNIVPLNVTHKPLKRFFNWAIHLGENTAFYCTGIYSYPQDNQESETRRVTEFQFALFHLQYVYNAQEPVVNKKK